MSIIKWKEYLSRFSDNIAKWIQGGARHSVITGQPLSCCHDTLSFRKTLLTGTGKGALPIPAKEG